MSDVTKYLKELFPFALKLQEMAPWRKMYERDLFGINIPDSDTLYFCSVMGSTDQFYGITY